ncbi:MAG: hypothetical protein ACRERE_30465 [Candidatus Entotheonellia bacterium]
MFRNTWTGVASAVALVMVIAFAGSAMAAAKKSFPLMGQEDSPVDELLAWRRQGGGDEAV